MKRILGLLLIPLLSFVCLFGCDTTRTIVDVKELYVEMVEENKIDNVNNFFSDYTRPNSIVILYPTTVNSAINILTPSNEIQKRYKGIYYQQKILDNIFDYYTNYQEDFYRIAESKEIDENKINNLYNKLSSLKETLKDFTQYYDAFINATENGISDVMAFNITSYTFHLNTVIDSSFAFIDAFHDVYVVDCIEDYSIVNEHNVNVYIDKAYIDLSYIVYLENIKAFNYSVGENGICDLSGVIGNLSENNLIELLNSKKHIKLSVIDNIGLDTDAGKTADELINIFTYSRDIFEQRKQVYLKTYTAINVYEVKQYKFNLNGNVDYNNYLMSLSDSEKSTVILLDNFVDDVFLDYVSKLQAIVE